jgi:flagellar hook-associated protein 3 FlgL
VTSDQDYFAKAAEIDQLIEQGLNVANTKLRGAYLFAGDAPDNPAFTATRTDGKISAVTYAGSLNESPIRIGEDTEIKVGATVDENKGVAQLLNKLVDLRNAMSAPSSTGKASTILALRSDDATGLDAQENKILTYLSRAGTVQYRLEVATKDLETRYDATEQLISTDADIDFAEATVRLNRSQMAYQAAIQSGAMIQRNSLLDFVR